MKYKSGNQNRKYEPERTQPENIDRGIQFAKHISKNENRRIQIRNPKSKNTNRKMQVEQIQFGKYTSEVIIRKVLIGEEKIGKCDSGNNNF